MPYFEYLILSVWLVVKDILLSIFLSFSTDIKSKMCGEHEGGVGSHDFSRAVFGAFV